MGKCICESHLSFNPCGIWNHTFSPIHGLFCGKRHTSLSSGTNNPPFGTRSCLPNGVGYSHWWFAIQRTENLLLLPVTARSTFCLFSVHGWLACSCKSKPTATPWGFQASSYRTMPQRRHEETVTLAATLHIHTQGSIQKIFSYKRNYMCIYMHTWTQWDCFWVGTDRFVSLNALYGEVPLLA